MDIHERYRVIEKLGRQRTRKFGEVFLAVSTETQEKVVLKTIKRSERSEHLAQRLISESSFHFSFPGLPEITEIHVSEHDVLLVRKYVEGHPLNVYWEKLRKRERIPFLIEFLQKLSPIFSQLAFNGVVHCDIKPENILIREATGTFCVELIDFGLAHRQDATSDRSTLFPLGFAAPELLLNHLSIVDQTTDIYALGITFWYLFTGKLPLTHPNPGIFTNLQLTHQLPEHSDIPGSVYPILRKMSHKHAFALPPNRMEKRAVIAHLSSAMGGRYQNIDEIREALLTIHERRWWKITR